MLFYVCKIAQLILLLTNVRRNRLEAEKNLAAILLKGRDILKMKMSPGFGD
jgi:hypothetical protein